MSNETDLDWLARNVHAWPKSSCSRLSADSPLINSGWEFSYGQARNPRSSFTEAQWLDRRAELQNKPSWSSLQRWAKWIFQNGDGFWYATENKPSEPDDFFRSRKSAGGHNALISQGQVLGDWRDTLERRPESNARALAEVELVNAVAEVFQPFTSIEDNQEQGMAQQESTQKEEKQQGNGWFERGELPPVGVECEFMHPAFGWTGCDIVGHYRLRAVCAPDGGNFYGGNAGEFRPIRTEREKAIEEMMEHCKFMGTRDFAGSLFDAGYRKDHK